MPQAWFWTIANDTLFHRFSDKDEAKLERNKDKSPGFFSKNEFDLDCGSKAAFASVDKEGSRYTLKIGGFVYVLVVLILFEVTSQHCASH